MKATGQLTFTRQPDGTITRQWSGGRRVAVSGMLLEALQVPKPYLGRVVPLQPDLEMRLIAMDVTESAGYCDSYIAMREGILPRLIWRYWRWLSGHAHTLFAWECRWIRWRKVVNGEVYPKWSLVGILLRPLI